MTASLNFIICADFSLKLICEEIWFGSLLFRISFWVILFYYVYLDILWSFRERWWSLLSQLMHFSNSHIISVLNRTPVTAKGHLWFLLRIVQDLHWCVHEDAHILPFFPLIYNNHSASLLSRTGPLSGAQRGAVTSCFYSWLMIFAGFLSLWVRQWPLVFISKCLNIVAVGRITRIFKTSNFSRNRFLNTTSPNKVWKKSGFMFFDV